MDDRRLYPRVNADVFLRPVGKETAERRKAVDVSLGGMCIESMDPLESGDRLELDLKLSAGPPVICTVEVVWVAKGTMKPWMVGVKFVQLKPADRERLVASLER